MPIYAKNSKGELKPIKINGIKGDKGDKGDAGAVGPVGPAGADGLTTKISVNGKTIEQIDGTITLPNYSSIVEDSLTSTSSVNALSANQGKVLKTLIDEGLDGHKFKFLTQAEYDALSEAQKNNKNIEYHITDAVAEEYSLELNNANNALSLNKGDVALSTVIIPTVSSGGETDLSGYATIEQLNTKANVSDIPTTTNQLINNSGFVTETEMNEAIAGISGGGTVTTEKRSFRLSVGRNDLDASVQDCTANIAYTKGESTGGGGGVSFTNIIVNSDTFEAPAGAPVTYWQKYKVDYTVTSAGAITVTGNTDGTNGLFKLITAAYHDPAGEHPLSANHCFYSKYQKSTDGSSYTIVSKYWAADDSQSPAVGTGGRGAILSDPVPYQTTFYYKNFIMVDLTEIYGAGNEPDKDTCDSIFGELWAVDTYSPSAELNNNFTVTSYNASDSLVDSLNTAADTTKNTLSVVKNGYITVEINDVAPVSVVISEVDCITGGGTVVRNTSKKVTLNNVDRLLFMGDSYTEGIYYQKGKAWVCQLSEQLDYTCEGYGFGGYTSESLLQNIQSNLGRYNPITIKNLNPTRVMIMTFVNDMVQFSYDNTRYLNGVRNLSKEVEYLGAKPIICTEFRSPWGYGLQQNLNEFCSQNGYDFFNILPFTNFLGNTTASDDSAQSPYYSGSHPAQRTGGIIFSQYLRFCKNLPRPISAIKIYRKRNSVTANSLSDIFYTDRRSKLQLFKEILISHSALSNETDWDSQDNLSGTIQNGVTSEYGKIMAGQDVSFTDYALVEVIVPTVKNKLDYAKLCINDSSVSMYVKKQRGFEAIAGGVVDDITNSVEYDKITFLLYKEGGFTINDIYLEWRGEETPKADVAKRNIFPANATELLSVNTFGSDSSWYTTVGTVNVSDPTNYTVMPTGCTKLITITNENYINVAKTITSNTVAGNVGNLRLRIVARYNPAKGSTEITENSYDRKQIKCEFKGASVGVDHRYTQYEEVDMAWTMVEFDLLATDNLDVNIMSVDSTALEICYISLISY